MAAVVIGCNTGGEDENEAAYDPEGTVSLDMTNPSEMIDNAIVIADGNFTGGNYAGVLFATVGKVKGLAAITGIPPTGWVNKLAVVEGHGYIAYSPSKNSYWRLYASKYDDLGTRSIIKFQRPFLGSEKEIKLQSDAAITLVGTEAQDITFANSTLFPFSYSFENNDGGQWCSASYSRSEENAPYNSIRIYASKNSELTPRECTLVLKSDIGEDVKIKIVQAAGEGSLSVSNRQIYLSNATSQDIYVTSNAEWTASSSAAWCTVSPASGNRNGTITVSATPNTNSTQRDAIVTITTKDAKAKVEITVTQPAASLSLSQLELSLPAPASQNYSLRVYSNSTWTASCNQSWCTVTRQDNNYVTVAVTENLTGAERTAVVTVAVSPELKATLNVTQAKATLTLSKTNISFTAVAAQNTFTVTTDVSSWEVRSNQTWCTVTEILGLGSMGRTVNVSVSENSSDSDRTADITVLLPDNQKATVTVTQTTPTLTVYPTDDISFTAVAAQNTFTVFSDASSWEVSSNQTWCTVTKNGSMVNVSVSENSSDSDRTAEITVALSDNRKATVTVTQTKPTLTVSKTDISFTAVSAQNTFTVTSNVSSWEVSSDQSWCTATKNGNTVTIDVTENQQGVDRNAVVTVSNPKATVNITQAKPTLTLSKTAITITKTSANSETFTVTSNVSSWTTVSSNQNWCTVSKSGNTVTVSATPNTSGSVRQATITILDQTVTVIQDGYQVGDYYNVDGVEGVVFTMTGEGHGKIASMDETTAQWATANSTTGATNATDGLANMNIIKAMTNWETAFPAFGWCGAKNIGSITGWYLPAREELNTLYNNRSVINITMQENGGTDVDGNYWSSTERSNDSANSNAGTSIDNGYSYYDRKSTSSMKVRAIKAF